MGNFTAFWTSLLGVIVGAATTYSVQRMLEYHRIRRSEVSAIRNAQFVLSSYANFAGRVKLTLEPYKSADDRHTKIVKHYMPSVELDIRMCDLSFLVHHDKAQLLMEITMAVESHKLIRELLDEHHKAYDDLFANAKVEVIDPTVAKVGGQFSPLKVLRLKSIVDLLYKHTENSETQISKCVAEIFAFAKSRYTSKKFIKLVAKA